ncbi:MAG: hypothetical protein P8X58_15425, partial [Syntrophobacterales bacterium]
AGYAWFRHESRLLALALNPWGWLVFLLLTVPWFWAMEQAYPGLLRHHIVNEQILRFFGQRQPPDIIPFPLPGFWLFLFIWLLPWGLLLPEALYRFWGATATPDQTRRGRLLLIWAVIIMGFFSLSSTRIEYYSLPALPALALVLGWRLSLSFESSRDRGLLAALFLLGLLGLALMVLLPYLEQICAANRREFFGMFPGLAPASLGSCFLYSPGPGLSVFHLENPDHPLSPAQRQASRRVHPSARRPERSGGDGSHRGVRVRRLPGLLQRPPHSYGATPGIAPISLSGSFRGELPHQSGGIAAAVGRSKPGLSSDRRRYPTRAFPAERSGGPGVTRQTLVAEPPLSWLIDSSPTFGALRLP